MTHRHKIDAAWKIVDACLATVCAPPSFPPEERIGPHIMDRMGPILDEMLAQERERCARILDTHECFWRDHARFHEKRRHCRLFQDAQSRAEMLLRVANDIRFLPGEDQ